MRNIVTEGINEPKILQEYEEAVGILLEVKALEGAAVLIFRISSILLPSTNNTKDLESMIEKRIAVLRTDLPNKLYIFRTLD
ncbi:MAG: hypothetical protein PWQ88_1282 [Candidatus Methanomethylophilaceae archaeon]|nr:hypothetical protein [Candidatus Methanomethylophilaceae archaeon]MDI3541864.1 hypothetical protein [Candidatus Methanomethylophilaceae archaeon]